jgi:hypothetical protein
MSQMKIKIAQLGLGPIGIDTLKLAATKPWVEIIGGIDIDPLKVGRNLTDLTGIPGLENRMVYASLETLLASAWPDVVLHTSVSRFKHAFDQIEPIARHGINVVSSCEELLYPQLKEPDLARRLDECCRKHSSRVIATGVNPGFVMDVLAVCLTGVCRSVERVEIDRVVDASKRRLPLQRKIGSGLSPEEFRKLFRHGKMGHVGLVESLALVAHCLGWKVDDIRETCEPVIARKKIRTDYLEVARGLTCGIHHRAEAVVNGETNLILDLKMYLDAKDPQDAIKITGDPPIEMNLPGGIHGDRATVAALINTVPRLLTAPPGVLLMTDIALPRVS